MEIILITLVVALTAFSIVESIWFAVSGSKSYRISVRHALLSEVDKSFIAPDILKTLINQKVKFKPLRYFLKVFGVNLLVWPYSCYSILVKLSVVLLVNIIYEIAIAIKDAALYVYNSYKNS